MTPTISSPSAKGSILLPTASPDVADDPQDSSAALKQSLWNIFTPPSDPSDPSRISSLTHSPPVTWSNFGDQQSSSNTTNSPLPHKKSIRRARFENDPEPPVKSCCRRCGRDIAPGTRRAVTLTTPQPTPEVIAEIPNESEEPTTSLPEPPLSPPPPLIPLAKPTANERRDTIVRSYLPRHPGQYRRFASRVISDTGPASTVTTNSELVERTKGLMAALSPNHKVSPSNAPSRYPSITRSTAATSFTFPRTGRLSSLSLSQFISHSRPTRSATYSPSDKFRVRPPDGLGRRTKGPQSVTSPTSHLNDLPVLDISASAVLNTSPESTPKVETDTSGPEDSPVQEIRSLEPRFLELPISDSSSVLCISGYLASIFEHKSSTGSLDHLQAGETQDDEILQDVLQSKPKFTQEDVIQDDEPQENIIEEEEEEEEEDTDQVSDTPSDWNTIHARESGEASVQLASPMEFNVGSSDGKGGGGYTKRCRSWNVRPRRSTRRVGKLPKIWNPPDSWAGPPKPHLPDDAEKPPVIQRERSNTASSLDDSLKPLTYLVHHQMTSSIDVCSMSDPAKTSSEGCLPSSEGTIETDDESIRAAAPLKPARLRKYGWQEPRVLEALPKLKDLRLGKNRK